MLIFAVIVGVKIKEKTAFKLKFLFGVEIPLLGMVIIRREMFYDLSLSMRYLFLLFFVLILIYSIKIFIQRDEINSRLHFILKLRKLLLFTFAIFFSTLFIITTIPLGLILLKGSLNPDLIEELYLLVYLIINILIIVLLILALNPAFSVFKYSLKNFKYLVYGINLKSKITCLLSTLILFSALYFLNINKRNFTYLNLKNEPSLIKQKEMFFNSIDKLDKELRQAADIRYNYIGSLQNNFFCQTFEYALDLNENQNKLLQYAYNIFMYPFFYQDTGKIDYYVESEAKELYEQLFDKTIYESKYNYDYSWGNVHIDKQEINIKEYDDIAEIQICETYSTNSNFLEEIIYHFALPYNSVITGLWISDDQKIDKKYSGLVAPSGAAQKVYINEVLKQFDPALLSQIGPEEYLLRAFPIMSENQISRDTAFNDRFKDNYEFRLWFTYKTFISENNNWALPKLLNKQNVKWSDKTETLINGVILNRPNSWLPKNITATKPTLLKEHSATISNSVQINSKPIEPQEWFQSNENIALLIDGSYSMSKSKEKLLEKLSEIKKLFPNFNDIDCFIVGNDINKLKTGQLLEKIKNNPQLFFGNTNYMKMLEDFTTGVKDYANKYESVILLSDISYYYYPADGLIWNYNDEGTDYDTLNPNKLDCPFIIIKLAEDNYWVNQNNFFNQIVYKSHGGFAKNKSELINLLNINNKHVNNLVVFQNNVAYFKSKVSASSDTLFTDFATKEFINHYRLGDSTKLADIDILNEMAKKEHIVTNYSSMIALVNQEQVDSLKSTEIHPDRYNNFRESNSSGRSSNGILGLLDMFGTSVPKHTENMVIFTFLLLVCFMVFADRLR
jgi:hypothetical protein